MSDWAATVDKKSGKTYYYNRVTKETSWERPEEMGDEEEEEEETMKKKDKKKKKKKQVVEEDEGDEQETGAEEAENDPDNWAKTEDKVSGKTYYYNKVTKTTSWKPPACMPQEEKKDKKKKKKKADSDEEQETNEGDDSDGASAAPKKASKAGKDNGEEWAEAKDPASGRSYWFHKKTKETTWKDPYKKKSKKALDSDDEAVVEGGASDEEQEEPKEVKKPVKRTPQPELTEEQAAAEAKAQQKAAARQAIAEPDETGTAEAADGENMLELAEGHSDDEDAGGDSQHTYRFAKHRKGWFNRLFRVGEVHDDAKLLTFKKSMIKKALLKQNRDLDEEAVQAFKNIMSYMGDRKSSKNPLDHAKKLLRNLMVAPAGLRDEVYMQLCKQTTRNPRVSSAICGWELMTYCLATFPPSKHLRGFLTDYIKKTIKESKDDKVVELAELCAARVSKIVKMGQRKQVPSRMELECLRDVKPVPIRVHLVNKTNKTFYVDPYTLVQDVEAQLVEKYNLVVTKPFALYEACSTIENEEKILDPKDRILDVQAAWENKLLMQEELKEQARQRKLDGKPEPDPLLTKDINFDQFLFKAKLVLKTSNQEIISDPEAINLIYIQAIHDVVTSRYPCNEKVITVLAALQLQAAYGDYKKEACQPGWLLKFIDDVMPKKLTMKKDANVKSEKLQKEWETKIILKYEKVGGFTALEAKLNYLDYVQDWPFYGTTFFVVRQKQLKDYPEVLHLGINCEGVLLMHPAKETILDNWTFTDIVTWGHSDEKFILVVGNIVQQRKLIFPTFEGKAMNHLIHDYVKFKVKAKP